MGRYVQKFQERERVDFEKRKILKNFIERGCFRVNWVIKEVVY